MAEINLDALLESYRELKQGVCESHGEPTDTMAMLHVGAVSGKEAVVGFAIEGASPTSALPIGILQLRNDLGDLEWAVFLADSYVKCGPPEAPRPHQGDLSREFETEGTATGVSEALVASWATADGRVGMTQVTYHYEGTVPIFDEPDAADGFDEFSGRTFDALKLAFAPLDRLRGS